MDIQTLCNKKILFGYETKCAGSVSMLVGSKSGVSSVSSVSRGTYFDWLSHQGPPISGTRYTRYSIACFALLGCIMDKFLLNIYKIYHL